MPNPPEDGGNLKRVSLDGSSISVVDTGSISFFHEIRNDRFDENKVIALGYGSKVSDI